MGCVVAVADCFEAMTSPNRYYQDKKSSTDARKAIVDRKGTQFRPDIVEALRDAFSDIDDVVSRFRKGEIRDDLADGIV